MTEAGEKYSFKKQAAQVVLLGLPTLLVVAYALDLANRYLAFLENNWFRQTCFFASGMMAAFILFGKRFRFVPITVLAVLSAAFIAGIIGSGKAGEFDGFFWQVRFTTAAWLTLAGWIAGYGFSRARFFSIAWSVFLLAAMTVVVAGIASVKVSQLMAVFAPLLVYAFYIIYISELLRNINDREPALFWKIFKKLSGFALLMAIVVLGWMQMVQPRASSVEKEWTGRGGKKEESGQPSNSLTRNDGSGTSTAQGMGLSGFNNKANKDSVLFVARLEHYFPDGKTPNPLYFTTDYFSKFNTETQAFETDTLRPMNDLFSPDVSQIPLFFSKQDTSVLRNSMATKFRRQATAEVYKHNLSARLFTAPSTAFFVQPITVPDENRNLYSSAYRARMMVSELNSAYFVYNPAGNRELEQFQESRFQVLRKAGHYDKVPKSFYDYYTFIPKGNDYDSIRTLAARITDKSGAKTTIDKIIAIRDYFLEQDENGQPTFRYSDNPGIPGMPSANKLTYFLFQNKKGYCAYFAGATLFMLRALGIPSRVATGFLTVERSNKNPGWYWFYEDQAHAWVQAYFPEFGWIDFDTTVPDTEQQQAPQPDQTPPLTTQTAWLVANGTVSETDTASRQLTLRLEKMLYWDEPYDFRDYPLIRLDVSLAKISHDTGTVSLSLIKPGQKIVAVSYAGIFKDLPPSETDSGVSIIGRFPSPVPVDEIKLMLSEEEKISLAKEKKITEPVNWATVFKAAILFLLLLAALLLAIPSAIFYYLRVRAARTAPGKKQQYFRYMAAMFYLHQLGVERNQLSPLRYAAEKIDPVFHAGMEAFLNIYLKLKYSPNSGLSQKETDSCNLFYQDFFRKTAGHFTIAHRVWHFLQFQRAIAFFSKPGLHS